MSMRSYSRDDFEGTTDDAIRKVEHDYNARMGAVLIIVAVLCALFLISQETQAQSVARKSDWQDQRWEAERSDTNIFTRPSQVECMQAIETQIDADAKLRKPGTYAWYTCGISIKADFIKPPVVPTCTAPKPADETQTATCPSGTVGTFGQTRAYVVAPHPVCWAKGDVWIPIVPPAGTCPPAPSAWTKCADEGRTCLLTARSAVRYGANTTWSNPPRNFDAGSVFCGNTTFGDPLPGVVKRCEYGAPVAEPDPPTPTPQNNELTWSAVTRNTDGSVATIASYRVYASRDSSTIGAATAQVVTATRYDFGNLASGTWYFGVIAVSNTGAASVMSQLVTKAVP